MHKNHKLSQDIRAKAAKYYELAENPIHDIPFYQHVIPSSTAHILELGCGTGRVLLPLTKCCASICGLDCSEAMLVICQQKLRDAEIPPEKAHIMQADITDFDLHRQFDLIIAPYRVLQNIESDEDVYSQAFIPWRELHPECFPSLQRS